MKTTKIYLAAALMSLGAGLRDVDRSNPRQMEFILTNSSPIVDDEDAWFYDKKMLWEARALQVNAQEFVDALKVLQAEVHK